MDERSAWGRTDDDATGAKTEGVRIAEPGDGRGDPTTGELRSQRDDDVAVWSGIGPRPRWRNASSEDRDEDDDRLFVVDDEGRRTPRPAGRRRLLPLPRS